MPIVYTPTVGAGLPAVQPHLPPRARASGSRPTTRGRIAELLRNARDEDVRLIVVTDNERILGLGDQGAGGMGIPIGKLALYTAGAGIHPVADAARLSLDVGTDNQALLDDPLYIGWRHPRLRGDAVRRVRRGVRARRSSRSSRTPCCSGRTSSSTTPSACSTATGTAIASFNDDIQGTAGVAVAGLLAALRITEEPLAEQRIVFAGAGAAGVGIARLVRAAMRARGRGAGEVRARADRDARHPRPGA